MYIFQKVEKVNNRANALFNTMNYEISKMHIEAENILSQTRSVEDAYVRANMYRQYLRLEEEALEIEEAYNKLKKVMERLH